MVKIGNLPEEFNKQTVKERLKKICKKNDVILLALFGSFVRGEQKKKSDIDILIKFDTSKEKSLLDLIHTENELKELFGEKVDLLTQESISPYLRNEIISSMKVIYEKR